MSFDDALLLVAIRAKAMQKACEVTPSTMAAVLNLPDEKVEAICAEVQKETGEVVVPANYNCPGQLVISGSIKGIDIACERMKAAGAKRAVKLPVGGAFHSPLMQPHNLHSATTRLGARGLNYHLLQLKFFSTLLHVYLLPPH